jgi:lipoprotein-anchoring transpeptidase ErfK/SrfK
MEPELFIPPVNAGLDITPDGIKVTPAEPGRELDLEETLAVLPYAFGFGTEGLRLELLTRQVAPAILSPGSVQARAEAMLSEPFVLTGTDGLLEFRASWSIPPEEMAGWLDTRTVEDEEGARLVLTLDDEALYAAVEGLNSQLSNGQLAIEAHGTAPVVRAAIEAGEHSADATLIHLPRVYTVQPGDTLMRIAAKHGYPAWRLVEANPGLDVDRLSPGQEVTIPSLDLLFPLPLIRDRRIVIDIAEQHLYAYEGDRLIYSFVASTGIKSSPTITGTFQVLSKEEEAYASNWDLWMPHFVAVYESAPGFMNGIHGLPTLSSGRTLWEGHLGRPVSYGCIVLGLDEAKTLYEWAELGTLVEIRQ